MSLNDSDATTKVKIILKNAEQYQLWKARVSAACWAATRQDIFEVTDQTCLRALEGFDKGEVKHDWVGKCWIIITSSLHDELFLKTAHVRSGHIAGLLKEIRAALLVNIAEDIQPLRLELYSATMQANGNDLQAYISFLIQRRNRLLFLEVDIPAGEMVHIFLKGLHSIFQPLQVHFAVPGTLPDTFDKAVEIVRKFAATPVVHGELNKLKSNGLSQNVFATISREKQQTCKRFATTGKCLFGNRCHFSHTTAPHTERSQASASPAQAPQVNTNAGHVPAPNERKREGQPVKCDYCGRKYHTQQECRKRINDLENVRTLLASAEALPVNGEEDNQDVPSPTIAVANSFMFAFSIRQLGREEQEACLQESACVEGEVAEQKLCEETDAKAHEPEPNSCLPIALSHMETRKGVNKNEWVLDSGASMSATHCERDCTGIQPCNIEVTAAGATFVVLRRGTAVIRALDSLGKEQAISVADCLISPLFPCKLLALQAFTKKGFTVTINDQTLEISKPTLVEKLMGKLDSNGLYTLQCVETTPKKTPTKTDFITHVSLLAKAYGAVIPAKDLRVLWRLHLRHGHRNFLDLCRQYSLPLPKEIPACTSCVMGKGHAHPHHGSFQRATRRGEGFHSDFRGPFSTPTPQGALYLLTIVDDFSRRIFPFLVKSQSEWFEIWRNFVARVEAELGHCNCISWILSDNGQVYKASNMTEFCTQKGIQQRFSAPYAQWLNHTAERNMRTLGEMALTTMIHANMPKRVWGWAMILACEVLNRTSESTNANTKAGAGANASRLERWHGKVLPHQTKNLYPFGCLCFKQIPPALRGKLDAHAIPMAYLGVDPASRTYLLGTLYELHTSVGVEVTFFEDVFPFRKFKAADSPASLLWGSEAQLLPGDPRLGMFETNLDETGKSWVFFLKSVVR